MIELNAPSTESDWLILILLVVIVYLVFRK
jgi:hypothetical protein